MNKTTSFSTEIRSPVGPLLLTSDETGEKLTGIRFGAEKHRAPDVSGQHPGLADLPLFRKTESWLERYFAGKHPSPFELPLAPQGSPFRLLIWALLQEIPYGHTTTYGELAKEAAARLNKPKMSAQAAGGAVGHNPIAIIIPCHRVIGADGSLTGFGGGLSVKRYLLELEGIRNFR